MKVKVQNREELQAALPVILEEALEAAREFAESMQRFKELTPDQPDYASRYGELASAAFLLKLKAQAVHETLERLIEMEPDD